MAGDAEDGFAVAGDFAAVDELFGAGDGDAAGGFGEDAFVFGEPFDAIDDFFVGAILSISAGLAHGVDGVVAVGGSADGETLGDGLGLWHGLHHVGAALHGVGNRGAAGGLGTIDGKRCFIDDSAFYELSVGFVDLRQERAAGHGCDGVAGDAPAELLHDFEAHGLAAFSVIGAEVYVDEAPAVFAGDFGAEAVDLIVGAVDADDLGAIDEGAEDFALLKVGRDEDVAFEACCGSICGDAVCEVAGAGAGDGLEPKLDGAAERDADDAVFKGECRVVDGVVFDVEGFDAECLREAIRLHERGKADLLADGGLAVDGEELPVAPHGLRAALNRGARDGRFHGIVIISGLQRAEVEFANVDRLLFVELSTFTALEIAKKRFVHR